MQLQNFKSEPLDSCDKNLVNTKAGGTIGDYLCGQVRRWLKNDADFKANGRDNIKIPFYYSSCGEDWTPVSSDGNNLYTDEELCCDSLVCSEDVMVPLLMMCALQSKTFEYFEINNRLDLTSPVHVPLHGMGMEDGEQRLI